jgi:2-polyprenyl-3-methyl-5-hydroxy-6-metoxy-1,4-benzoquinol methylase
VDAKAGEAAIDVQRVLHDHPYLKARLEADLAAVASALQEQCFPMVAGEFVRSYLEHIRAEHLENPLAARYIEAELGAPGRQAEFLRWLGASGLELRGKSCLDVGCNNGCLALACADAGARRVLGIDISDQRLAAARQMCAGRAVEFRNLDILEQQLAERFEVVLCTDVLEHVPEPARMLRRIGTLLDHSSHGFACVTLHNKLHPDSVLSEPHYDVPGMVLLPHHQASRLWHRIRERYRSKLDYEVSEWHSYDEYSEMARSAGFCLRPLGGRARALAATPQILAYRATFAALETSVDEKLRAAPLRAEERAELTAAVRRYLDTARREHAEGLAAPSPERLERLFFAYHLQPLVMILERPRPMRWLARLTAWLTRRADRHV